MDIALIDDDITTNFIHKTKILKYFPEAKIHLFNNGKEALEVLLNNSKFDYAFLDLNMPIMNGIEFLQNHKKLNLNQKIKHIILFIEQDLADDFIEKNEIYMHLKKPLNDEKINRVFEGK
jgi:two-component SAPR family response regulator